MNSEKFQEEITEVNGVKMRVTTYKIGDKFHCHVATTDPGATIARASSESKEEAQETALNKAEQRVIIKGRSL
jgi:hypothetical protein